MTDRIKELRIKIFDTQSNMAKALNLKPNAIGAYETGIAFLKPDNIALLINEYNVNANWLLAGKGNMFLSEQENTNYKSLSDNLKQDNERLKIENTLLKELINKR